MGWRRGGQAYIYACIFGCVETMNRFDGVVSMEWHGLSEDLEFFPSDHGWDETCMLMFCDYICLCTCYDYAHTLCISGIDCGILIVMHMLGWYDLLKGHIIVIDVRSA